ncbi:MAG TPA: VOC family protein [Stellaceae bacterium]|nr:VOC family protein [Stellaceae bacterium]
MRILATFLAISGAVPGVAASLELPSVVEPASHEHHVGKVILLELVTPDLGAAKRFYGGLLGWTFRDVAAGTTQYAEALLDGRPVAGLIEPPLPPGKQRAPAWLSFFAVEDVDAAEKIAVQHGAKVLFPPHTFPDRGREAVFADPQGAVFAVLASSSGDPPDFLAEPGEWIWSSLITRDPGEDAGFYQALFGYDVFELAADPGTQHLLFASGNYARASANSLPRQAPNLAPHWLNFLRVEDAEASVAKVVALGGRVLVAPHLDRQGGKVAVVADPQGASFGLLEWKGTESQRVPQ